ncbi:alpha/beta hydrolase [Aliikangiella sp. IMCC44359]|uniref:alpha/beta hydrolase n=1 Tax=Aliikangiella sp. IMCC44359 TaxID=3459125 RepID=UPI00403B15AC
MKKLKILSVILTIIYLLVAALLFLFQRSLLYFPSSKYQHNFNIEKFYHQEATIEVIVLNPNNEKSILYFGGNAESVVNNADQFSKIFPSHTVYLVNYRGYAGSTGNPSEKALFADAQLIFDNIKPKHSTVSVMGRSLGSGVAVFLASTRKISKMVLVTPYDSIQQVAQERYPIFPTNILLKDHFDSISRVKKITATTLIILAEHDKVISKDRSKKLIDAFPSSQITTKTIMGSGHNNLSIKKDYYKLLIDFLEK